MFFIIHYETKEVPAAQLSISLCHCPGCHAHGTLTMEFFNRQTVSPIYCYSVPADPSAVIHCSSCGETFAKDNWGSCLSEFYKSKCSQYRAKFRIWLGKFMIGVIILIMLGLSSTNIENILYKASG